MEQRMLHSGNCIFNGPLEVFRDILKRERYYGNRFTSRDKPFSGTFRLFGKEK